MLGCLPDPLKAQESLRELQSLLVNDEVVRNKLYQSINVNNDYQNITSAKVRAAAAGGYCEIECTLLSLSPIISMIYILIYHPTSRCWRL